MVFPCFSHEIYGVPVNVPSTQSIGCESRYAMAIYPLYLGLSNVDDAMKQLYIDWG